MQNMGLAAGHCGQAHVKKSGHGFYNFRFAPKNWLMRTSSTHEGRLNGELGLSDRLSYTNR